MTPKEPQRTLARPVACRGVGLHGGQLVSVCMLPAEANSGIVFRRMDQGACEIPARWDLATDRPLCTTLSSAGTSVRTTEHLMCALYASGVDNVVVEIDRDELPILDGSARPYIDLIESAGLVKQGAPRRFIRIRKAVEFRHNKSRIRATPAEDFHLTVVVGVKGFGRMEWSGPASRAQIREEIAPARTFGPLEGAVPLMIASRLGGPRLLRGASMRNAVVHFRGRVLNRGGLRFDNEFVRHHTLDTIGDLGLAGAPILGHITAEHTRHGLTQQFLKQLMNDREAWEYVSGA